MYIQKKDVLNMSDEQLINIVKNTNDTDTPNVIFDLAKSELKIRYGNDFLELISNKNGGVVIKSKGDMVNNGTIITDRGSYVNLETAGKYTSEKGKIIQGKELSKKWWESGWFQVVALVASILGIISFVIYISK